MGQGDKEKDENVVSIAEARKRQRTLQKNAAGARQGARKKTPGKTGLQKGKQKIWHYVQFFAFLVVMAYFMHLCRG